MRNFAQKNRNEIMKTIDLFNNNHKPYAAPRMKVFQMDVEELMQGQGGVIGSVPNVPADGDWDAAPRRRNMQISDEEFMNSKKEEELMPSGPFPYL